MKKLNPDFLAKLEEVTYKLIARAWADSDFYNSLISHPKAAFQAAGIAFGSLVDPVVVTIEQDPISSPVQAELIEGKVVFGITLPTKPENLHDEGASDIETQFAFDACSRGCSC